MRRHAVTARRGLCCAIVPARTYKKMNLSVRRGHGRYAVVFE
ncbi:hypothetical protein HMPREF9555_00718 [Selenomonas artemidis F0399]|uniref:Uncharacterized protein n=1 Tax=Selenomonas artemidis F0399 TaxID=749551 RepID=E7N167_9FIRM|nr:hypothetical protein HMPREF9555_00718 [Selenomonas artemidis F0399]